MSIGITASTTRPGWNTVPSCDICGETSFQHALDRAVDGARLERCEGCGFVFLNPRPSPDEAARWYEEDYFTGAGALNLGDQYLANAEAGIRHGTEHFFQLARRQRLRRRRLLEVGVGGGAFIVQCHKAGARVAGLDVSEFAVQRLRGRYGIDVRSGTVETTSFVAGSFDIVTFTDVLEHVPSPTAFMGGIHRLLANGGVVFGVAPNLDCAAYYGPGWAGFRQHAEHLSYFGPASLARLLRKVGLETLEIWSFGEPSERSTPEDAQARRHSASLLKEALRPVPGLMPTIRALRRWRGLSSTAERTRQARYRQGLGHDLYFRAVKP